MKTTQFENMKKAAEVLAAFGDNKSTAQVKRYMALEAAIVKIEGTTQKQVVTKVLDTYRSIFNELPKEVRGFAKKEFCAAISEVLSENGTLFVFDMNGNIIPNRVLRSIKRADNADLFTLLGNLFSQAEALEAAQAQAQAQAEDDKLNAYLSAMDDELNEYSVAQLLAA